MKQSPSKSLLEMPVFSTSHNLPAISHHLKPSEKLSHQFRVSNPTINFANIWFFIRLRVGLFKILGGILKKVTGIAVCFSS